MTENLDVPPIAPDLAAVLARAQATADRKLKEAQPETTASTAHFDATLAARGFPARHRAQLREGLHGPGMAKATELLPRILSGDAMIFLIGDRGPGKTQMATWWAAERLRAGLHVGWYRKTADLISEIKTTWSDGGKSVGTENDLLKKYRQAAYLVLDEFHERGSSEWEARTLLNILDHRYDSMLVTVLISNQTEAQVREQVNPSILSRCEQTGGLVPCDWPSYRSAQ